MKNNTDVEQDFHTFLKNSDYRYYPSRIEYPYEEKALYQKKIDNISVCETNNALHINVHLARFQFNEHRRFEVEIVAEKLGIWWRLIAYSLSESELIKRLPTLESQLVYMFNSLTTAQECDATGAQSRTEPMANNQAK